RHEDAMDAPSREAVFESLRARGIRPIKVVAADGSKANGEQEEGRSKRGRSWRYAAFVILVSFISLVSLLSLRSLLPNGNPPAPAFETAQTRRYPIGDAAVVEKGILTGWSDVFPEEGERFFASFAVPGVKAGQRNTTVEELSAALKREVAASPGDGMEARQIKAMVEGMKAEARAYVAAGGNLVEYGRRLTERQDAEIAIYERAKADLEAARASKSEGDLVAYWEALNDRLRNLGIRLLPLE
ncbi:MAG: hypothetical protein IJG18_12755, partial [Kiritimatiellae bacterium]|nr:hypothetical protein [Kiritimatiellia bacterium]